MRLIHAFVVAAGLFCSSAYAAQASADQLFVIACGQAHADDQSRWSPGVNVGRPIDLSDNCYLIRHAGEWLLWDTGIADAVAERPEGLRSEASGTTWKRTKTLATALAELGLSPGQIHYVAVSHSHPDHIGNVALFPQATLLVQAREYDWPQPDGSPRFAPGQPVHKLNGDFDVFGDGSVVILSTPGHTPGHQSLLVHLRNTGAVVLSGDVAHFRENWDNRRVPSINVDGAMSRASMERIAEILLQEHGELWINHDIAESAAQRHAPQFYD